ARLRRRHLRDLQRARRRRARVGMPGPRGLRRWRLAYDGRGPRPGRRADGAPGCVHPRRRVPMRYLHARPADRRDRAAARAPATRRTRDPRLDDGQPVSLHGLLRDREGDHACLGGWGAELWSGAWGAAPPKFSVCTYKLELISLVAQLVLL